MQYMTPGTDIAGYAYGADIYCPGCIQSIGLHAIKRIGGVPECFSLKPDALTEDVLSVWAKRAGIDTTKEYDQNDFPAPISVSDVQDETCGACKEEL